MTQEDKELLLKDLSGRLSYGVICECLHSNTIKVTAIDTEDLSVYYFDCDEWESIEHCKPYLRPMSSMTEEENNEWRGFIDNLIKSCDCKFPESERYLALSHSDSIDWLNAHHFDYRGLIERGLAIEVTEENNPYKE